MIPGRGVIRQQPQWGRYSPGDHWDAVEACGEAKGTAAVTDRDQWTVQLNPTPHLTLTLSGHKKHITLL